MITSQPIWKFIDNLGDANPIEWGGYFIYEDDTGVYCPEGEELIHFSPKENDSGKDVWHIYRFALEKCIQHVTWPYTLSDNPYHPNKPAWFAPNKEEIENRPQDGDKLKLMAESVGISEEELRQMFCSWNTLIRARAWELVGHQYGFENLDGDPITLGREEIEERYAEEVKSRL